METHGSHNPDPAAARAALDDVGSARGRVAGRITTPWWYRVGWGLTLGLVFVGFAAADSNAGFVAAGIGGIAVLSGLSAALARTTGVALDRYTAGRPAVIYVVGALALFVVGLVVRSAAGQWWAMVPFAVAVLAWTLLMEPRIDAAVRARLRSRNPQ